MNVYSKWVAWATDAIQQRASFICLLIYLFNVFDLLLRVRQCAKSSKRDQSRRVCFEECAVQQERTDITLKHSTKMCGAPNMCLAFLCLLRMQNQIRYAIKKGASFPLGWGRESFQTRYLSWILKAQSESTRSVKGGPRKKKSISESRNEICKVTEVWNSPTHVGLCE